MNNRDEAKMKVVLLLGLVLCVLTPIRAQGHNYLLTAFESAMAMKANFEYNANYYRDYFNYEKLDLSRTLTDRVVETQNNAVTETQGAAIRSCALMVAYYASTSGAEMEINLMELQNSTLDFYKIILDELVDMNILAADFEIFYYEFNIRLYEAYDHLNDVLLQTVFDSLLDFMAASRIMYEQLDTCLNAV